MRLVKYLKEIAYIGNVGFSEMVKFYQLATPSEIREMEEIVKNDDWLGFKKLIKKVVGVSLK